jgi:hypothetical protein
MSATSAVYLEPSAAALRSRCRRCQCVLPMPTEPRRAICCRGCHRQFYRTKCRVCDEPSPNGRLHASKCSYAHKQNPELYAFKPIQKPSDGGLSQNAVNGCRNPRKDGAVTR